MTPLQTMPKTGRSGKPRAFVACPRCPFKTNNVGRLLKHIELRHEPRKVSS